MKKTAITIILKAHLLLPHFINPRAGKNSNMLLLTIISNPIVPYILKAFKLQRQFACVIMPKGYNRSDRYERRLK